MERYRAVYKCQLCGQHLQYGEPHHVPYDKLSELLGKVIRNQQFIGNPYLYQSPMHIPHKCKDGSAGLAYFVGFQKV